jgi:cytochrome c oxidase assembly factor CtaG/uncharacterized membrane protein
MPTLTGHSASSGQHELAIASLMVHVVCAALWVGGLFALLWVTVLPSGSEEAHEDQRALGLALARFSNLALVCWIAIGVSGVVNAGLRLGPDDLLGSSYGVLVLCKVMALVVLGAFGRWHRQHTVEQLQHDHRRARPLFTRVAAVELLVMGATFGLAVGLSRTPTPGSDVVDTSPAFERLGFDLPPAPDLGRLVDGLTHDGFALVVLEVAALAYAFGVRDLQRRGERWPGSRTLSWYAGVLLAGWASVGGLGLYAHVMFSVHLAAQMVLGVLAPVLLVLGSPLTLALATLPGRRTPRERGLRQLLQHALDSRTMQVLGHPVAVAGLYVVGLAALYLTSLFESLMGNHLGHSLMQLGFLALGCLLVWTALGPASVPYRSTVVVRATGVVLVAAFLALVAIVLGRSEDVLAEPYYVDLHRSYSPDLLADQHHGVLWIWLLGVLPLLVLTVTVVVRRGSRRPGGDPLIASNSQVS